MRRSAGPSAHRPLPEQVAKDRTPPRQDVTLISADQFTLPRRPICAAAGTAPRWLLVTTLCASVILLGCEQTESVQTGLRGSSAIQLYRPSQLEALREVNRIPDPEPSDPYDPSFPMATEVHQNVEVLTDLNALEFARLMNAITTWVAPEQGCAYCHNPQNLASDEKFTKLVSREMLKMTRAINTNWQSHVAQTGVTCWTCHRGQAIPSDIWFTNSGPETPSAGISGWKGGQNVAGVLINGNSSLPFDPLTPFLDEAYQIAIQGTEVLPYGNRQSIKQAEWTYSLMMYMSKSLGVNCTYCHHTRAMGVWDQSAPQRVTAWHGVRLVRDLNESYLNPLKPLYPADRLGPEGDAPKTACGTCHKGTYKPLFGQTMLDDYPSLAGVLPGRLDPDAEAAAIAALSGVASESPAAPADGATDEPAPSTEPSTDEPPAEDAIASEQSDAAAAETDAEAQAASETDTTGSDSPSASDDAGQSADAAAGDGDAASDSSAAPTLEGMTISEIEAALDALIRKINAVRDALDTIDPPEPDASTSDGDTAGASAKFDALRALLTEQAAQLEAARRAASALGESRLRIADAEQQLEQEMAALQQATDDAQAAAAQPQSDAAAKRAEERSRRLEAVQERVSALRARLDQERLALQQQLEVVREQRDRIEAEVTAQLSDEHEEALTAMEQQLVAANARLEQERHALQQQLEVVREQRREARTAAASKVRPERHAEALASAEARIRATRAKLDQQRHALQQQLTVVRAQRDAAREQLASMVPRDEHQRALAALEQRVQAMQARLAQNSLALQQQLAVVRAQRDRARASTDARIAELHALHQKALADQREQIDALEARLAQNLLALNQQLEVVRDQRDSTSEHVAQRVAAATDDHRDALEAKRQRIAAMQVRLDQNRLALEQQLQVVRQQRDAASAQAEQQIAAAMDEHEDLLEEKQQRLAAMQARLSQNRNALEQQLEVVREQRNAAKAQAAERLAELTSSYEERIAALQGRIDATEARLSEERETLERQLAIAREERDAVRLETEARIAELTETLADERAALAALREGHSDQVQALNQQLAEADAEVEQLRADMQAAEQAHAQALAQAKGSVTRIRLLHEEAAELGARVTDDGIRVNLGSDELRFASGSATLPTRQLPTLERTAALLRARPELTARIEGHTDSLGSPEINRRLSQQRAEAVRQALIALGIEPQRLTARGAGSAQPIADNTTPQGRRENRRVEIYVTAQEDDFGEAPAGGTDSDTESG